MKTNIFFKSLAYAGLTLAAALFLGIGLASCSKDKNKSKPEPESITLTTDIEIGNQIDLWFDANDEPKVEGAEVVEAPNKDGGYLKAKYKLNAKTLIIKGKVTKLTSFDCGLTALDVTKNPNLIELNCGTNSLKSLDLSKNTNLVFLSCPNNENLKKLNLSSNIKLEKLYCGGCGLSELDLSKNVELKLLRCSNNALSKLDLSGNPKLSDISCFSNKLDDKSLILRELESEGTLLFKREGDTQKLSKSKVQDLKVNKKWAVFKIPQKGGKQTPYVGED